MNQESPVFRVILAVLACRVARDLLVTPDFQVIQVARVIPEIPDLQGLQAPPVLKALLVSRPQRQSL